MWNVQNGLFRIRTGQARSRALRSANPSRLIKKGIINLKMLLELRIRDHGLKLLSPQDLLRQVTRPGLCGLSSRLDGALKSHHDFKLTAHHLHGTHVIERRGRVDSVHYCQRPDKKEVVVVAVRAYRQFVLVHEKTLALPGEPRLDQLGLYHRRDYVRFSHVAHPEHQTQLAVLHAHSCVLGEEDGLSALFRTTHFRKNNPGHQRLDHYTYDGLQAHQTHRLGTFLGCVPAAVPDRVLRLN